MVRVSIASLIYKSTKLADWVFDSVHEFTPMLVNGEADFFFVANDASDRVVSHLQQKGYKYFEQNNEFISDERLFEMGHAWPEYIHRVYKGYNRAILEAKGEIIVLINSDHYFSPDWLENLLKYYDSQKIVCSQLVEPKHARFGVFNSAINGEFGNTVETFNKQEFLAFANIIRKSGVYYSGAYMPCMFNRDFSIYSGLYPEGNLAGIEFNEIAKTGDEAFFDNLAINGIVHITAMDSIVYHLKEGEKDEEVETVKKEMNNQDDSERIRHCDYKPLPNINIKNYRMDIRSTLNHSQILEQLLYIEPEKLTKKQELKVYLEQHLPPFLNKLINFIWDVVKKPFRI